MSQFWKKEPFYRAPKIILHFGGTNIISADCTVTSTYVATLIMMNHKLSTFVQQYYFFSPSFFSTKYSELSITAFFKIRKQLNRKYKEYNYLNKNISTTSKINVKKFKFKQDLCNQVVTILPH